MDELTDDQVRWARAGAQRLHRPEASALELVRALLAVQAQDIGAAPLALRARSRGLTASAVERARTDRSIVRAWGPRGTLHLIAAEDVAWLVPLTGPNQVAGSLRRLAQEGVPGTVATLVPLVERVLADQGPLTKAEFAERLGSTTTVLAKGQGLFHLLGLAAAHGKVVLGPDRGNKPTYVHAGDWLGVVAPVDRGSALAELVRRYLRAHAPAAPEDLVAWSGLSIRDIRAGWSAVADELVEVRHGPRTLWRPRRNHPAGADVAVALLPAFDELLLGWRDRSLILEQAHTRAVLPGGGILRPFVLAHGRIAGTWRGTGVELFDGVSVAKAPLSAEQADIARFLAG